MSFVATWCKIKKRRKNEKPEIEKEEENQKKRMKKREKEKEMYQIERLIPWHVIGLLLLHELN